MRHKIEKFKFEYGRLLCIIDGDEKLTPGQDFLKMVNETKNLGNTLNTSILSGIDKEAVDAAIEFLNLLSVKLEHFELSRQRCN